MTTTASRPCPTCRAPASKSGNKLFPFCSERCHLVDLGRWLGEEYRVPEEPSHDAMDAIQAASRGRGDDES